MSASTALRRSSRKQLWFSGPWARGRLPATAVPGHASTAFTLLIHRPALHPPMPEKSGRRLIFVTDVETANADWYSTRNGA